MAFVLFYLFLAAPLLPAEAGEPPSVGGGLISQVLSRTTRKPM
jgi:hypothetical protein